MPSLHLDAVSVASHLLIAIVIGCFFNKKCFRQDTFLLWSIYCVYIYILSFLFYLFHILYFFLFFVLRSFSSFLSQAHLLCNHFVQFFVLWLMMHFLFFLSYLSIFFCYYLSFIFASLSLFSSKDYLSSSVYLINVYEEIFIFSMKNKTISCAVVNIFISFISYLILRNSILIFFIAVHVINKMDEHTYKKHKA